MIADERLADFHAYVAAVSSGEIVVCQAVKDAIARHQRDLERQETDGFPYFFDEDRAAKVIRWFPENLRHTVGRFSTHRFELEPWQQFGIGSIHGWRRVEDGTRRFRRVFWSMGRKNGKSTLAAGMGIYGASADEDPITRQVEATAQVVIAAAKREQADIVTFAEIARMVESGLVFGAKAKRRWQKITFPENDGHIITVGSNKPYDGLNASLILLDETHAWTEIHRPFYDTMTTGGASRSQPLTVMTTTAGDTSSDIWHADYEYSKQVAAGVTQDDRWFAFIFEIDTADDPFDEDCWVKANPNLGVSVSADYLREQATIAKRSLTEQFKFTRYHGNRIVSNVSSAFDLEQWDACQGELSDWGEADAICGGIDLGGRDDLSAVAFVARFVEEEPADDNSEPVYRYEVKTTAFLAEDTLRDCTKEPFCSFINDGLIRQVKYLDKSLIDEVKHYIETYYIYEVAYDPAGGRTVAEILEESTGCEIASMAQNPQHFHEPISDMMQTIRDGRFRHDGSPLLRWCAKNAIIRADVNDRWMFDKRKSAEKIDPIVATAMAYRRAMLAPRRSAGDLYIA